MTSARPEWTNTNADSNAEQTSAPPPAGAVPTALPAAYSSPNVSVPTPSSHHQHSPMTSDAVQQLLSALSSEKSRNVDLVRQNLTLQSSSTSLLNELESSVTHSRRLKGELAQAEERCHKYRRRAANYRDRAHAAESELAALVDSVEDRRMQVLGMFDSLRAEFIDVLANWSAHIASLTESEQAKVTQLDQMKKRLQAHAVQIAAAKEQLTQIHVRPNPIADTQSESPRAATRTVVDSAQPHAQQSGVGETRDEETDRVLREARARLEAVAAAGAQHQQQHRPHPPTSASPSPSRRPNNYYSAAYAALSRSPCPSGSSPSVDSCRPRSLSPRARVHKLRAQAEWEAAATQPTGQNLHSHDTEPSDQRPTQRGRSRDRRGTNENACHSCAHHSRSPLHSSRRPSPPLSSHDASSVCIGARSRSSSACRSHCSCPSRRVRSVSFARSCSQSRSPSRGRSTQRGNGAANRARSKSRGATANKNGMRSGSRSRARSVSRPRNYPEFLSRQHASYLHTKSSTAKMTSPLYSSSSSSSSSASTPRVILAGSFPERPCSGAHGRDHPSEYGRPAASTRQRSASAASRRAWTAGPSRTSVETMARVRPIYSYSSTRGDIVDSCLSSSQKQPVHGRGGFGADTGHDGVTPRTPYNTTQPTHAHRSGREWRLTHHGHSDRLSRSPRRPRAIKEPTTPPERTNRDDAYQQIASIPTAGLKTKRDK